MDGRDGDGQVTLFERGNDDLGTPAWVLDIVRRIGREGSWLLGSYQWNGSTPHESAWVCGLEITRWNGGVDAYGNP